MLQYVFIMQSKDLCIPTGQKTPGLDVALPVMIDASVFRWEMRNSAFQHISS